MRARSGRREWMRILQAALMKYRTVVGNIKNANDVRQIDGEIEY